MSDQKPFTVHRVSIDAHSTQGEVLKLIDAELKEAGDRLGLHWGFYLKPFRPDDAVAVRHARLWPDQVAILVRSGDNEGWMVELWEYSRRMPTDCIGMAKILDSRENAFEFAGLVSFAAGCF